MNLSSKRSQIITTLCTITALGWSVPAFAEPIIMKIATVAPDGSPWSEGLQNFKKSVETAVPGKIKVKLFLGGTLGDENETVRSAKLGQIQAVGASTGALATVVPEMNVLELPFLFDNTDEVDHIIDTVAREQLDKAFLARGMVIGFWSENGFRNYGGKFPVTQVADLKGHKVRSQENPIHIAMHRAFGASPVPIPTTEVLTSLQTGVVDGYDQAPLYTFAASWHTASTHYSITNHMYQGAAIVMNKAFWDGLPADVQQAIKTAGDAVVGPVRSQVRAMTPILIENLAASNVKVNTLSDAARAEMAKAAVPVRTDYAKKASAGEKTLLANIEKGLKAYRASKPAKK